ncbi:MULTISPECIES: carbohydrate kinase family protein [unclassified Aureimonas]|uniref:carbohydrate kinase family protein n=1 Tax=unclassified Aureimonas TaxID=2615206 RepID=UPI0006FE2BA1|nr:MULTISPECIES: carbohydrate kinase family protein [unclassified Aureimonas]KQT57420.1 hypothetical protein ASG62_08840 [Aureimonas sp. Leaf427]KQT77099.1 hypothetical protein ASG54_12705 [Aureimonas sp. Leaf460]
MSETPPSILAIGAAHLDRRARSSTPFQKGASNPGVVTETVGGAAFNAALAMRLFGARVRLCTTRGGDLAGERVAEAVEAACIDEHAFVWLDRTTATYNAILDDRGDLVAGIADMAIYDLLGRRLLRQRRVRLELAEAGGLLLDANLSAETIAHLLARFGERPTAAIAVSPAKAMRLSASLPRLGTLFLSRAEAATLVEMTPATDAARLAQNLVDMGVRRAVVTDGPHDAALIEDGAIHLQAPPAVASLRDVTGAGDTLAGVAFQAIVAGRPFLEAARLGMAAASRRISMDASETGETVDTIARTMEAMAPPRSLAS